MTASTPPVRSAARTVGRGARRALLGSLILLMGSFGALPNASAAAVVPADSTCSSSSTITVDAHEDDDLFFQNPDVLAGVRAATLTLARPE